MQKFSLELPKYRLELHTKLVKRRKPLIPEPLVPTIVEVKKKYRTGSIVGKITRYFAEHKSIRQIFAGNLAFFTIAASFLPVARANDFSKSEQIVIQTQNPIATEKGTQIPLDKLIINQGFNSFHPGLDLDANIGDPIKSMRSGKVIFASYTKDGYGNQIVVDHGNGLTTRYAHLSKILVKVGDGVTTNDVIGLVGVTGYTTGPHLHFETRVNNVPQSPFNYIPTK